MSEMIDRIARAMATANSGGDYWDEKSEDGDGRGYLGKNEYRMMAVASIDMIREPTDAMINAAMAPYRHEIDEKMRAAFDETIRGYWRSMIDEMLK